MKFLLLAPLLLLNTSSVDSLIKPIRIPINPYNDKSPNGSDKVHKRCKRFKNYWKCIDRFQEKSYPQLK